MYEPLSRRTRAANYRRDAMECERAGFSFFAALNLEMAAILDPPPREQRDYRTPQRAPGTKPVHPRKAGADTSRVGGQRDAAPLRVNNTRRAA